MKRAILFGMLVMMILLLFSSVAAAQVGNVTSISRGASERATGNTGASQEAMAGNTTGITITATDSTRRWQGFFGNVTGGITLSDASSNSLYDWDNTNPSGEVFAANHSGVAWTQLFCVNFSGNGAEERYNSTTINNFIGYSTDSELARDDAVNSTFNQTFEGSLQVGSLTFTNADNCSMITLNDNTGYQTTNFQELLMTDNESIVFTSILEDDQTGFNGAAADFEMIVGVDGTTFGTTRNYFFFVELS